LIALAALLLIAVPADAARFGKTTVGSINGGGFSAKVKRCSTFKLNETGNVTSLGLYTGGTPGYSGSQVVRGVIYSMSGSSPRNLKATSDAITVKAGQAMDWQTLSLPSAVTLDPGTYCLGTLTGATEGVADFRYASVPGSWFKSDDSYSDGASNPFGTPSATGDIQLSIYASYTPTKVCDKYAATTGSDAASGSASAPYATIGKLVTSLATNQTGCLTPTGTFVQKVGVNVSGITLKTDPRYSTRATVRGRIAVNDTANNVWFDNITINGDNADLGMEIGLQVFGDGFKLTNSELHANHSSTAGSCALFGYLGEGGGVAYNIDVERNRIHDCGSGSPYYVHGLYLSYVIGGTIRDNYIHDNAGGWDMHLYPDADGLTISNNTMDGSAGGVMLAGEGSEASDSNTFANNIMSNPTVKFGFEHYWGSAVGTGNAVSGSCVDSPAGRTFETSPTGYTVSGTVTADPQYVNRAAKDFRLSAGSPCAGKGVRP